MTYTDPYSFHSYIVYLVMALVIAANVFSVPASPDDFYVNIVRMFWLRVAPPLATQS